MANRPEKIEFICQSFEDHQLSKNQTPYDILIFNMVLHHMPSPAFVFKKAKELVSKNGSILIADLASHSQDWVKDSCGDVWLGFEPEEVDLSLIHI